MYMYNVIILYITYGLYFCNTRFFIYKIKLFTFECQDYILQYYDLRDCLPVKYRINGNRITIIIVYTITMDNKDNF